MTARATAAATLLLVTLTAGFTDDPGPRVDWVMVARIREEGLQRSQVMNYESYMTDVLGARLTLSNDMKRAQQWALGQMRAIGLANVTAGPYINFGVTWDNEFTSLHMLAPTASPWWAIRWPTPVGRMGRRWRRR
jgi:hypothetical protein